MSSRATHRTPAGRLLAGLVAGVLAIQAAWILVVPPFRGLDEHDHAYKAAAVARGDWKATHKPSGQGWGEFVKVPSDIVSAARPICEELPYTTPDNCRGTGSSAPGLTTVASSAARYNPVFYFVIGSAARPFEGVGALYAMRIAAALVCAAFVAFAIGLTRTWSRSPWPVVGILLAITPTFMYSTVVAAPNGVEMAAALAFWSSLLGLVRTRDDPIRRRRFVVAATVAAVPLAAVRGLGPLWLVLAFVTVLPLLGRSHLKDLARSRATRKAGAIILVAMGLAAAWTVIAGAGAQTATARVFDGSPWPVVPGQWVLWFFQSMAAFPARDELAEPSLYIVGLVAWWVFVAVAWRPALARERGALVMILVVATVIPAMVTVITYASLGTAWQGRYGYPYTVGFFLICGYALDRASTLPRWAEARWPIWLAGGVMLSTELIGQLGVLTDQVRTSPLADGDAWIQPNAALVVALNVAGVAVLTWCLTVGRPPMGSLRA